MMRATLKPMIPLLAALTTALAAAAEDNARGLATPEAIRNKTDSFMDRLENGRILAAYKDMKTVLGVDSAPFMDDAEKARKFLKQVRDRIGAPLDSALIRTDIIEGHFQRLSYLQKFQSAALHWRFTFYRPQEQWQLVGVSYSTDLDSLYRAD